MSTASDLKTMRPTWAEIDTAAFGRNLTAITRRLPARSRLIAVMKANAYGHGAAELAKECTPERVAMIAVVMLEEALELRRAGVTLPLLVLGPLTPAQIPVAVDHEVTIGIPGPEELEAACGVARDRNVSVHLKLDTGMGRMGIVESELPRAAELIRSAPRLRVEAIYTHFANAGDPRDSFTDEQMARFETLVATLKQAGVDAPLHHTANSAATMRGLVRPGDYVRVGIALYGAEALDEGVSRLEPVMRWRTEIARLKELPAGHAVGYGMTFRTRRPSRIATLPVGYADGYHRLLSNRGEVLVRGRRAPVVGRVSMDLVTIDVTEVDGARVGDEVVLLGDTITPEEIASKIGTISYEVLCSVGARVPRVYRAGDRITVHSRFA
jgi:alanine racemase